MNMMRYPTATYKEDKDTGYGYLTLAKNHDGVAYSEPDETGTILMDYDRNGRLVGIEIAPMAGSFDIGE